LLSRSRFCINPLPQNGGKDCVGKFIETLDCNTQACPDSDSLQQQQQPNIEPTTISSSTTTQSSTGIGFSKTELVICVRPEIVLICSNTFLFIYLLKIKN
jgi:hypothetical protein